MWIKCCYLISSDLFTIRLHILHTIERGIRNVIELDEEYQIQSLSLRCKMSSLFLFYKSFHYSCFNELSYLVTLLHEFKCTSRLVTSLHRFNIELAWPNRISYTNSFFSPTCHLYITLPGSCCQVTYHVQTFKCNADCNFMSFRNLSFCRYFSSLKIVHSLPGPVIAGLLGALSYCLRRKV